MDARQGGSDPISPSASPHHHADVIGRAGSSRREGGTLVVACVEPGNDAPSVLQAIDDPPSIVNAANLTITPGLRGLAFDIHLAPQRTHLRVRFCIDGTLTDRLRLPHASLPHSRHSSRFWPTWASSTGTAPRKTGPGSRAMATTSRRGSRLGDPMGREDRALPARPTEAGGQRPPPSFQHAALTAQPGPSWWIDQRWHGGNATRAINALDPISQNTTAVGGPERAPLREHDGPRAALLCDPDVMAIGELRERGRAEAAAHPTLVGHLILCLPTPATRPVSSNVPSRWVSKGS
jgi:hypothetical protein